MNTRTRWNSLGIIVAIGAAVLVGGVSDAAAQYIPDSPTNPDRFAETVENLNTQQANPATSAAASPADNSPQPSGRFALKMVPKGDGWKAVRYDRTYGRAWSINGDDAWIAIQEANGEQLAASKYLVQGIPFGQNKTAIIRIDEESGKTWFLRGFRWIPMNVYEE